MIKSALRSQQWFRKKGKDGFIYRAWMKNQGISSYEFEEKPIIGICNTWSELTPCNSHFRELAESVKRGILEAGGFPVEFPVMSLGETLIKPTAMLYRNLVSMDVEESIRANPLDGVVLMCGCDKTTPALVMGACSVDIPSIVVSVILHVSPEVAENGTIALVKDGDMIQLDVPNRTLNLLVKKEELDRRRAALTTKINPFKRGYARLYVEHVEQAHLGADFDFLKGGSGSEVSRDSH